MLVEELFAYSDYKGAASDGDTYPIDRSDGMTTMLLSFYDL
jgi:hypothetical protein